MICKQQFCQSLVGVMEFFHGLCERFARTYILLVIKGCWLTGWFNLLDLIWLVMNLLLIAGHNSLYLKDEILLNKLKKSWSGCCEFIVTK